MASDFILDNKNLAGQPGGVVETIAGEAKKRGLIGANPAGNEGMFGNFSEALSYNNPSNLVPLGESVFAANKAVPPIATPPTAAKQPAVQPAGVAPVAKAPTIAGASAAAPAASDPTIKQFSFNKTAPVGATTVANGGRNDWSADSPNAIAGSAVDSQGRTYDQQVAHAAEINKQTMAPSIGRKEAWDMSFVGAANSSNPSFRNAMLTRKVHEQNNANIQADAARVSAQKIAGIGADANRYNADQHLAGVKYNADQHLKGNEVAALAGMEKAKIAGKEKQAEKQHEAYLKDENEMKALLRDKYGVDPNVGLSAYKQHLQGLQAWDKQITKQLDLLKSGKAGYTPEQGAMIENALRVYHQNPQDEKAVATLEEARKLVTGGGKAQEPAWWGSAVSMPKFDHQKLPQLPSSKTYIAGA